MDKKLRTPQMTALIACLCAGVLTHLFELTTVQFNYDNMLYLMDGWGSGYDLGRWLLQMLYNLFHRLGFSYNLPTVNGLIFLVLIALSARLVVSVLHIENRLCAAFIGMLMAVFPATTSILSFRFVSPAYALSLLLSITAVYVYPKFRLGWLLSILSLLCSCGIYQSNVPFTISLFLLILIQQALENRSSVWQVIRKGLCYCGVIAVAVGLYLLLAYYFVQFTYGFQDYQGANEMGKLSLAELPGLIRKAYGSILLLPVRDYSGMAPVGLVRLLYLLLCLLSLVMLAAVLIKGSYKPLMVVLILGLCALLPLALNFIVIMVPHGIIYMLMLYPLVLLPCLPVIMYDLLPPLEGAFWGRGQKLLTRVLAAAMALMVFCYGYYDNVHSTAHYYATVQTENYVNSIVVQVRMTEGFDTDKTWAFIGNFSDPMMNFIWEPVYEFGGQSLPSGNLNDHARYYWYWYFLGLNFEVADQEQIEELAAMEEVKAMPVWPNQGSTKVIGDMVVIKCQELYPEEG